MSLEIWAKLRSFRLGPKLVIMAPIFDKSGNFKIQFQFESKFSEIFIFKSPEFDTYGSYMAHSLHKSATQGLDLNLGRVALSDVERQIHLFDQRKASCD